MMVAFWKGEVDTARDLSVRLIESCLFETGDAAPNPIPTKAMLAVMGLPGGQCRLPLGPPPDGLEARAGQVLERLRALGSGLG